MDKKETLQELEIETIKKQLQQLDVEIAYRKVELQLLQKELAKK